MSPLPYYLKQSTDDLFEYFEEGRGWKDYYDTEFDIDKLRLDIKTMKKMKQTLDKAGGYDMDLSWIEFPTIKQLEQLNLQVAYDMLVKDTKEEKKRYNENKKIKEMMDEFENQEKIILDTLQVRYKKKLQRLKPKIEEFQEAKDFYKNFDDKKTKEQKDEKKMVFTELKVMKNKKKEFKEILKNLQEIKELKYNI